MTHREGELVDAFVQMSALLVSGFDPHVLSQMLADRCVHILDVADAAVVLSEGSRSLTVAAVTSDRCRRIIQHQIDAQEGPAIDALSTGEAVLGMSPAEAYARWTRFAARLDQVDYCSTVVLPLRSGASTIGSLSLFRDHVDDMSPRDLRAALALAEVAAVGIMQDRLVRDGMTTQTQLKHALDSRVLIEQAKGKLAESLGTSPDEAFLELRRRARSTGRRLTEVAVDIIGATAVADPDDDPARRS